MNNKRSEKELTKIEKERIENYKKESEILIKNGFESHDLTVNTIKANLYGSAVGVLFALVFALIYYLVGNKFSISKDEVNWVLFAIITFLTATFVHESIHGITWGLFCENHYKNIGFGVIWKMLTPYCTCLKPLKKQHYMLGSLMPCTILGVIPSIISIILGNPLLLIYGFFQIACAGGDLMVCLLILIKKSKKNEALYFDHPTEVGLVLFDK